MSGAIGHHAGAAAEEIVERHYEALGFALAHRRWRGKGGEIDLILRDGDTVVFVEVKLARSHAKAAEKVQGPQIARLFDAAEEFLGGELAGTLTEARFDVALVDARGVVEIRENAFL
ncbi:putative endonuclease [Palleronia aestuarii]|uniref:UPF0102 protein LX81_01026 n=1 Tax=Palleronia aestuarii TaxID=568105 RepID=A0A2W7NYN3_9RHOB|nr:YraN family protein [Palleronia aestuarii]PZX18396.1 putative endonuclease [Palleronia aestuarii]